MEMTTWNITVRRDNRVAAPASQRTAAKCPDHKVLFDGYNSRLRRYGGTEHKIPIQFFPASQVRHGLLGLGLAFVARCRGLSADVPDGDTDVDFCEAIVRALSILRRVRPAHYEWIVGNVNSIAHVPTGAGIHFYSTVENKICLDFYFQRWSAIRESTYANDVYLAAVIEFLHVQARAHQCCPGLMLPDRRRMNRLCAKEARALCVLASDGSDQVANLIEHFKV
jgi:hypothetical protein